MYYHLEGAHCPSRRLIRTPQRHYRQEIEQLFRAIYDAKPYRPDGIVEGKSLLELVTTPLPPNDYDYGFKGLDKLLHGIRYGELVTITAGSRIGKSSFCRQLATGLLQKGGRVGYLALEESNRRTALGLMSSAVGESHYILESMTMMTCHLYL